MPISKRVKAFLRPETNQVSPSPGELQRQIQSKDKEISRLRSLLAGQSEQSVKAENVVWIFGAGRTGSTWIAAMMDELKGQSVWFEPRVGLVFNPNQFGQYKGRDFILSEYYRRTWLNSIRSFVLDGADARFPDLEDDYLMIKDPAGSVGASWVMEALPESRIVLLVRDPRDYAASWLDAHREGGWQKERRKKDSRQGQVLADEDPDAFVKKQAHGYLRNVGSAKAAYDAHDGYKAIVRYEDLRADTLGSMEQLYSELGMTVESGQLAHSVEKHAWERIPEEQKGEGKFYRKAKPGGWRDDLTPKQARDVEDITGSLLKELYPDESF